MTVSYDEPARAEVPIAAEIPGVVVELYADSGSTVGEGDPVALLESMKMEIPVLAEIGGTIVSVDVAVGSAVRLGDPVVSVRPAAGRDAARA